MARKMKKQTSAASTPPFVLFAELLIPWLVMGAAAAILSTTGLSLEAVFIISILCALAATFLMREFERFRRRRRMQRST
jgi:membrane protein implicated in regulation of membrane protease activity